MFIKKRIDVQELEPEAYEIMSAMEKYLAQTDLKLLLRELIKIRVSQINKCAYCIEMHTKTARKAGETEQRIYALPAWEESPLFSEEERAVLEFAEEITLISEKGVSDATFRKVQQFYSDNQIAQMIVAINQINSWNRIAVTSKSTHPESNV